jgi:hypothetical protein
MLKKILGTSHLCTFAALIWTDNTTTTIQHYATLRAEAVGCQRRAIPMEKWFTNFWECSVLRNMLQFVLWNAFNVWNTLCRVEFYLFFGIRISFEILKVDKYLSTYNYSFFMACEIRIYIIHQLLYTFWAKLDNQYIIR